MIAPPRQPIAYLLLGLLVGCDKPASPGAGDGPQPWPPQAETPVEHDFGTIRHGETVAVDLEIPAPGRSPSGWPIPIAFTRDCSCARHSFVIVGPDGTERFPNGTSDPHFAVRGGDRLLLRLTLVTAEKEHADDEVVIRGQVLFDGERPLPTGHPARHGVPVRCRFEIDAPVEIRPVAHLDLGAMPRSVTYEQGVRFVSDVPIEYGEVRCLAPDPSRPGAWLPTPDLEAALEPAGPGADRTARLVVRYRTSPTRLDGPFAMRVEVDTDLDGYVVRLPVSGEVVPDIELSPPGYFNFGGIDFDRPTSQILMITDHDPSRDPAFVSNGIRDLRGLDLGRHFELDIDPLDLPPRRTRLTLRYLGTLTDVNHVRGTVHLAKTAGSDDVRVVDFSAFNRNPKR